MGPLDDASFHSILSSDEFLPPQTEETIEPLGGGGFAAPGGANGTDGTVMATSSQSSGSSTPVDMWSAALANRNPCVRGGIAGSPETPEHVLETLVNDTSSFVRESVVSNPKVPYRILRTLAENDSETRVRAAAWRKIHLNYQDHIGEEWEVVSQSE